MSTTLRRIVFRRFDGDYCELENFDMKKKKICWVSAASFIDVDIPFIPDLLKWFDIEWIVVPGRYKAEFFDELEAKCNGLTIHKVDFAHRARDPRSMLDYLSIGKIVKSVNADLNYIDLVPGNPWCLPFYCSLPAHKTIFCAHDGSVTPSMKYPWLCKIGFCVGFGHAKYINMFSKSQARLMEKNYPGHEITIIPLALKDFGVPTVEQRKDCVVFLYFGAIHSDKNIELLIEAANQLKEEGVTGFKVSINGVWRLAWDVHSTIRHPDIFELDLRTINNEEIPNLFAASHYVVYPYKCMSQSGALKVAYNYNRPVITSNLQGFTDEVKEGIDGFIFESENIDALKKVMKECINRQQVEYVKLQERMHKDVAESYVHDVLLHKYLDMFNRVMNI